VLQPTIRVSKQAVRILNTQENMTSIGFSLLPEKESSPVIEAAWAGRLIGFKKASRPKKDALELAAP